MSILLIQLHRLGGSTVTIFAELLLQFLDLGLKFLHGRGRADRLDRQRQQRGLEERREHDDGDKPKLPVKSVIWRSAHSMKCNVFVPRSEQRTDPLKRRAFGA